MYLKFQVHRYEGQIKRLNEELEQLQTLELLKHKNPSGSGLGQGSHSLTSTASQNLQTQIWNLDSLYKAEKEAKLRAIEESIQFKTKSDKLELELGDARRKLEVHSKSSYSEVRGHAMAHMV